MAEIPEIIMELAQRVERNDDAFGVLSTGEQLAVALVLDRTDLLDGCTMLEAVERLGPRWFRAALLVQRARH